jgi:hypothetical protein
VSRVWVELHYSLLQPPLRPTYVGCEVCSSCVSGFAALEGLSSYLFVSVFLFCFVLFLIRSFIFRSGRGEVGLELGAGSGLCRRFSPGKLRSSVFL